MKYKEKNLSHLIESSAVMRLAKRIYNANAFGFFGSAASGYTKIEKEFENGLFGRGNNEIGQKSWKRSSFSRRRRAAIVSLENSRICRALRSSSDFLLGSGCKFYGFFFLYFGLSVLLMNLIKRFAFVSDISSVEAWFYGILFLVVSLPLLISRKHLGGALVESSFFSLLLFDLLGISEWKLKQHKETNFGSKRYFGAALAGTLLGCASYYLSPVFMPQLLVFLLLTTLIINIPANGVLLTVVLAPVSSVLGMPTAYILIPVIFTALCLVRKIFLGKVIIKFEIIDVFVGLFLAVTVTCGFVSLGGKASLNTALLLGSFLLFYFVTVALITTREWINRIIGCASASAATTIFISLVRPFALGIENGDKVISVFENLGERLSASFGNPFPYDIFLTLAFPFFILGSLGEKRTLSKLASLVFAVISAGGIILYGSIGTQLGLIVSLVVFILLYRYTSLPLIIPTLLLSAVIVSDRAEKIISSLTSHIEASSRMGSFEQRTEIWKQAFLMSKNNFFTGAGVGNEAFTAAYSKFASYGSGIPKNCLNQYMQYLVEIGLPGLLLFIISVTLIIKSGLELVHGIERENKTERMVCVAGISSMSAILTEGLVNSVFIYPTVFFAFFTVAAITTAAARIGRKRILSNIEF